MDEGNRILPDTGADAQKPGSHLRIQTALLLCFFFHRPREGLGAAEMPYWLETGNPDQSPWVVLCPMVKAPACAVTQSWDPAGSQAGLPPSRGSQRQAFEVLAPLCPWEASVQVMLP